MVRTSFSARSASNEKLICEGSVATEPSSIVIRG